MADAITDIDVTEESPNAGLKVIVIQTRDTVDATDTITITLSDYGIHPTGLLCVEGFVHTTTNSIMTREEVTTSVTTGDLTITIPGGTNDDVRVIKVTGRAIANDTD